MPLTLAQIEQVFERNPYDPYDPEKRRMPRLKLACAFVALVDPNRYNGYESPDCMVGQVGRIIAPHSWTSKVETVANWSRVPYETVRVIFDEMADDEYASDYVASLKRACEILEVDLPFARALCQAASYAAGENA